MTKRTNFACRSIIGLAMSASIFSISVAAELPVRNTPIPKTTKSVPHVQIDVTSNPTFYEELVLQVGAFPGVQVEKTNMSLPGALGFRLNREVKPVRPESTLGGVEFAHIHADGSFHAFLEPGLAEQAIKNGWATPHPWASQNPGWDGFVMIYTPGNIQELNTVVDLVKASYSYVTNG